MLKRPQQHPLQLETILTKLEHRPYTHPPHGIDIKTRIEGQSRPHHAPPVVVPNMQASLAGAPNIRRDIRPRRLGLDLPQGPPVTLWKLEDEADGRHGLSLGRGARAPLGEHDHGIAGSGIAYIC